jgi:hypothetical protein
MTRAVLCSVVLAAGCASSHAPTLAADGYERVPIPAGCYRHVSTGDRNVALRRDFEDSLLGLLGSDSGTDPRCWHERRDGSLLAEFGDACGPHRTAEFRRGERTWVLESTQNMLILGCHERVR